MLGVYTWYIQMSESMITVRVPSELKRRMKRAGVNWSEELRRVIEEKLGEEDKRRAAGKLDMLLNRVRPGFDAALAVKEERRRG